jgi:hypothetical protein
VRLALANFGRSNAAERRIIDLWSEFIRCRERIGSISLGLQPRFPCPDFGEVLQDNATIGARAVGHYRSFSMSWKRWRQ